MEAIYQQVKALHEAILVELAQMDHGRNVERRAKLEDLLKALIMVQLNDDDNEQMGILEIDHRHFENT